MSYTIKVYSDSIKNEWDSFVDKSRNGTFLLKRDYMDYHSSRFNDYSLLYYRNEKLIALLPAHIDDNSLNSHNGLTYGGFIFDEHMTGVIMMDLFDETKLFLKENTHVKKFIYRPIPYIYSLYPSDEDLYALFRNDAHLIERKISSVIPSSNAYKFSELRNRKMKKAKNNHLLLINDNDYTDFWKILTDNLRERHDASPVHSLEEIDLLSQRFNDNILLYKVYSENKNKLLAGCIIYVTSKVAHVQYIASTEEGRECGAVDYLFYQLINDVYKDKAYFDLGTSVENGGQYLNEGLLFQKEGFGGRAVIYDTYEMNI